RLTSLGTDVLERRDAGRLISVICECDRDAHVQGLAASCPKQGFDFHRSAALFQRCDNWRNRIGIEVEVDIGGTQFCDLVDAPSEQLPCGPIGIADATTHEIEPDHRTGALHDDFMEPLLALGADVPSDVLVAFNTTHLVVVISRNHLALYKAAVREFQNVKSRRSGESFVDVTNIRRIPQPASLVDSKLAMSDRGTPITWQSPHPRECQIERGG